MPPKAPRQLPSAAELARTLLQGIGTATVTGPLGDAGALVPALHGTLPGGDVVLAVPSDARSRAVLALPVSPDDDRALSLCVQADAALADLTVPRAHLEVLGWASRVPPAGRAGALEALAVSWPVADLVERGPGYDLLRLEVAEVELHWVGGCTTVDGDDVRAAEPDPVAPDEADLLMRAEEQLSDRLLAVVRGLGTLPGPRGQRARLDRTEQVRATGVDRYGLTVQCVTDTGATLVVRLPFAHPVDEGAEAWDTITTELLTLQACRDACASATVRTEPA